MQRREMRTLAASPDYVVGSVHALTEGPLVSNIPNGVANRLALEKTGDLTDARMDVARRPRRLTGSVGVACRSRRWSRRLGGG